MLFEDWYNAQISRRAQATQADRRARRKDPPARRPITELQAAALVALAQCRFAPGSYDKRFARDLLNATELTGRQGLELARLTYRYRRQLRMSDDQAATARRQLEQDAQEHQS